jgi:hypothetical protein
MSSLPRHVLAEVMQRQTKPGDLFATCPFTRKQFADHHKWERGNAAHIVPHAIWAMLGLGSNCEFFANANNIIFVDQLVHFNLEAYNTIPSFSLLNVEGAQPPADFPDDVVYQIVFSRRLRPDHPLRSAIKGSTVHLGRRFVLHRTCGPRFCPRWVCLLACRVPQAALTATVASSAPIAGV